MLAMLPIIASDHPMLHPEGSRQLPIASNTENCQRVNYILLIMIVPVVGLETWQ